MILFKMEWKKQVKSVAIWTLLFTVLSFGFSAVYPQMFTPQLKESMETMLQGLPEGMMKSFNVTLTGPASMFKPVGFFAYYFQYLFLAACVYASLLGSKALVSEESDGTIDFLYAQPISRATIVRSKFLASFSMLALFWSISGIASVLSLLVFKMSGDSASEILTEVSQIFLYEGLILCFFLALGFFLSSLLNHAKYAISLSLALVFGSYLIGLAGGLLEKLSFLSKISPTQLGNPSSILNNGFSQAPYFVLISALLLLATFSFYQKRDFKS